jgi:hypothetical protein
MMSRFLLPAGLWVVLAACQTMNAPPLDEHTLTTANGVRFRTESGINDTCNTPYYSDQIGWGGYHVTVEQGGQIHKNKKFNFALPGQELDNQPLREARLLTTLFAKEYGWGCRQWQFAPAEEKPIYLNYFREAITLTFEAATRFEAAGRIGPDALKPEIDQMRDKLDRLRAKKPKKRYD